MPELLFTFGLAYVLFDVVQLIWGRAAVPYPVPPALDGPLFTIYATAFPAYRGFMMLVALVVLLALWLLLTRTRIGLVIQAALTRVSLADNQDMRRISAAVAMFAVPTTIGAIYGMNFDNMPELHTAYGYYVVLGVMALSIIALAVFFRRRGWL